LDIKTVRKKDGSSLLLASGRCPGEDLGAAAAFPVRPEVDALSKDHFDFF
jgi:hypothetical protein